MSMTTVLRIDDDQWRIPVTFGSAASLSSATAVSGADGESALPGSMRLSATAGVGTFVGGAGGAVAAGAMAASVVASFFASVLGSAFVPPTSMPYQAPAENRAAIAIRPMTTLSPGREVEARGAR